MSKEHKESVESSDVVIAAIEDQMRDSYLGYAMSVIAGRALPDSRDGLKPVHRRILYAMGNTGNHHNRPYRKSARIVGEVMGKYHPHGDAALYGTLARMAQPFSLRSVLIDGQGNFGSIDGDPPAQMRYTEARLTRLADEGMLKGIDCDMVNFVPNYDGSEVEPEVLPLGFPQLLVNGSNGIAVGMATNIPTHNLGEVIDACCAYLDNEEITAEGLLEHLPAPDFPTGGAIVGYDRVRKALTTGRGSIIVRGKAAIEESSGGKHNVIITEIPYQVNKADLVKNIELLVRDKVIDGIVEIRDESNKLGIRVVLELRRDVEPEIVINQLYRHTQLQVYFGVNILALKDGRPETMNIRDLIGNFMVFREEIVRRRTIFLLGKARDRLHLLIGLLIAVENIDEMIPLIRGAADVDDAKRKMLARPWRATLAKEFIDLVKDARNRIEGDQAWLSEVQVKAILEMRLQRLTALEQSKLESEIADIAKDVSRYIRLLESRTEMLSLIRSELLELKENFATPRLSEIVYHSEVMEDEDLIQEEDVVITVTKGGYIKRSSLDSYRGQKRGGRGKNAMTTNEDDIVIEVIVTTTHHSLLFFSDLGKVYRLKVYKIPSLGLQSKGRALVNLLSLSDDERITNIIAVMESKGDTLEEVPEQYIVFATASGRIRRNAISDFSNIPVNGKIAIRLEDNDRLIGVSICREDDHILLATQQGKAIRFALDEVRIFKGRTSDGVRAVKLSRVDDAVISLSILVGNKIAQEVREAYLTIGVATRIAIAAAAATDQAEALKLATKAIGKISINSEDKTSEVGANLLTPQAVVELATKEQLILTVTDNGYAKRTSAYEYRVTGRGGQGITNITLSQKSKAKVVSSFPAKSGDDIIIITSNGVVIRTAVDEIRITGRQALGVKVINLQDGDVASSISLISESE